MENVNKLLRMAFSALLFCIGVTLMMYEAGSYHVMLKTTKAKLQQDVIYQQYDMDYSSGEMITYAELVVTLLHPLEYDILLEGQIIRKSEHSAAKLNSYPIQNTNYAKHYRYDEKGNITMIIYQAKGG